MMCKFSSFFLLSLSLLFPTFLIAQADSTGTNRDSLVYYVQLAAFPRAMDASYFAGFKNVAERRVDSLTYRYFSGPYPDSLQARKVAQKALASGYRQPRLLTPADLRAMPAYAPEIGVFTDAHTNPKERLGLPEVKGGVAVSASNVFFGFDSKELDQEARALLDKVAEVLKTHPHYLLEVRAHTDNKGNELYNILLSEKRSRAVMDYLRDQGVPDDRMEPHIFGETTPIARNGAFMGRAMNRRVELVLKDTRAQGSER